MLAGIVVNNSILLVEFANQFRREGDTHARGSGGRGGRGRHAPDPHDDVHVARRFHPPRARTWVRAANSCARSRLQWSVVRCRPFLTLFVVPSFYVILHNAGNAVRSFVIGEKVTPATVGEVAGD